MPYWPSSRIVPQRNDAGGTKKKNRSSRKKGITIEDLKAQTAMRLAQEQGTARPFTPDRNEASYAVRYSPTHESPHVTPYGTSPTSTTPSPYRYPHGNTPTHHTTSTNMNTINNMNTTTPNTNSLNSHHGHQKLPHGLTVQELKEMTKARLHAETRRSPLEWDTASMSTSSYSTNEHTEDYILGRSRSNPEPFVSMGTVTTEAPYQAHRRRAATYSPRDAIPQESFLGVGHEDAQRARTFSTPALDTRDLSQELSRHKWITWTDEEVPLVTGLQDVFREPSPLGFSSGTSSHGAGGNGSSLFLSSSSVLSGSAHDSSILRGRASTWSNESPPSSLMGLSEDLVSILKLSGAEEQQRE